MTLPVFELEDYLLKHEHRAEISLCGSGLESLPLSELLTHVDPTLREQWESLRLGYSLPRGLPSLREAVSQQYEAISSDGVMLFSGASEAIYCTMNSLLGPEDHAVVVTPCYQSLHSIAVSRCPVTTVPLSLDDAASSWVLDVSKVAEALRPNTRAIVINFPNNPTGALPDRETMSALIKLARHRGIYIVSDEVYRLMEIDPAHRLPAMADWYERGVSIASLSKPYGLPGLRTGWVACRELELIDKLTDIRHYLTICNNTPGELLSLMALLGREQILSKNISAMRENLRLLDLWMSRMSDYLDWTPPKGGCLGFPQLIAKRGGQPWPAAEFALWLLDEEKVLILPAHLYQWPENRFRISAASSQLSEGLNRLERFITRHAD